MTLSRRNFKAFHARQIFTLSTALLKASLLWHQIMRRPVVAESGKSSSSSTLIPARVNRSRNAGDLATFSLPADFFTAATSTRMLRVGYFGYGWSYSFATERR